jgi:hypothetical protein
MATVFVTGMELPDLAAHTLRGGGCAILYIPFKTDLTGIETGGKWDVLAMLQNRNFDVAEASGSSKSELVLTLIDGVKVTLPDAAASTSADKETDKVVCAQSNLAMFNLKNASKGRYYFFVVLEQVAGTVKFVKFGIGEFARTFSRNYDYGAISATTLTINYIPYTGTAPTFPTLPATTDDLLTTPTDAAKKYVGWLFAVADVAKGGFGVAVTMVTGTDLPTNTPTTVKKF